MKRLVAALAAAMLLAVPTASAGPNQGGISSDNVEYVAFVPFEVGTATGARVIGKYMYVTSWRSFSIYDVSNPVAPVRLSTIPFGFRFENEDVATNGKVMFFSQELPTNALHIYDVEDKSNPVSLSPPQGHAAMGGHTQSCILNCKYLMGSGGSIIDVRDPSNPKDVGNWKKLTGTTSGVHDVNEVKPGFAVASAYNSAIFLDVRNPLKPKVLAIGPNKQAGDFLFHSTQWPRKAKDNFLLVQGEQNVNPQCNGTTGPFQTFDTRKWKKTHTFTLIDTFRLDNGNVADGSPPANGLGCSAHWFEAHSKFKNGGLLAMGYYEHGTRFLFVDKKGKISERGWHLPYGGSTSAAYWLSKDIVYGVDYTRGIDILRYTGKVK